ncbi:hypothetical protein NFI96_033138, partial [Prochilodus magdalenae]
SPDDVSPAEIFLGKPRVKEGQEVRFKCKVVDVRTRRVYVLLCKNGATVRTAGLEQSKDDIEFLIDKVTVEDSGMYTCSYTVEEHAACGNVTGRNSIALEVVGSRLQNAAIQSPRTNVAKGEDIELTCSISEYVEPSTLHMYLLKNGDNKLSNALYNKSHTRFSIKNVTQEDAGIYSCVYTSKAYGTREADGQRSILIRVYVTVEDSGLYTCIYTVEEHAACGNVTGRNSFPLEVAGEILPAKITATQSSLGEGEDLTLTCSTTVNQSCAEVYVYLCLKEIGKISRTVTCSINLITETFLLTNVKLEDSGNYSCVYSTSNHSLSEVNKTGENIVHIQVHVTVEDSGLYTCSYTVEEHASCGNVTGNNSIPLEVVGEILPAKITAAQSSLRQGENLTLTCSTTVNQSCAEVYVYLCLNGIGKISRTVTCSINLVTETFLLTNVKQEDSGNYSCVYSTSNHSLSEVNKTGGNTVRINVTYSITPDEGKTAVIIPLLVVAAALVLGMFVIHKYRDTITLRLCRNPATRPVAGEPGNSTTITYAKVQKRKDVKIDNPDASVVAAVHSFDSSGAAPAVYSLVMHCEEKTELPKDCNAEGHNTAKQVARNDMYAHYSTQVDYN